MGEGDDEGEGADEDEGEEGDGDDEDKDKGGDEDEGGDEHEGDVEDDEDHTREGEEGRREQRNQVLEGGVRTARNTTYKICTEKVGRQSPQSGARIPIDGVPYRQVHPAFAPKVSRGTGKVLRKPLVDKAPLNPRDVMGNLPKPAAEDTVEPPVVGVICHHIILQSPRHRGVLPRAKKYRGG